MERKKDLRFMCCQNSLVNEILIIAFFGNISTDDLTCLVFGLKKYTFELNTVSAQSSSFWFFKYLCLF